MGKPEVRAIDITLKINGKKVIWSIDYAIAIMHALEVALCNQKATSYPWITSLGPNVEAEVHFDGEVK